jgi:hypothetical protein
MMPDSPRLERPVEFRPPTSTSGSGGITTIIITIITIITMDITGITDTTDEEATRIASSQAGRRRFLKAGVIRRIALTGLSAAATTRVNIWKCIFVHQTKAPGPLK